MNYLTLYAYFTYFIYKPGEQNFWLRHLFDDDSNHRSINFSIFFILVTINHYQNQITILIELRVHKLLSKIHKKKKKIKKVELKVTVTYLKLKIQSELQIENMKLRIEVKRKFVILRDPYIMVKILTVFLWTRGVNIQVAYVGRNMIGVR